MYAILKNLLSIGTRETDKRGKSTGTRVEFIETGCGDDHSSTRVSTAATPNNSKACENPITIFLNCVGF